MNTTREPIQKRSIEKRRKILDAGFELFCENGYYKTNTTEIAKHANVSTGALYSYFEDKRQIYIETFEQYLNSISTSLFEKLDEIQQPFCLKSFIEKWVSFYVDCYAQAGRPLAQLRMMLLDDKKINHHFSCLESEYFTRLVNILKENGVTHDDLFERVYVSCILIDSLRQEQSVFTHESLNFETLKNQIERAILSILSE
ncbi:TetR/AcrR family transcriptional regulator [Oscillospiraceae bacterium PP1C4]